LHYSVTESAGSVNLTIKKKQPNSELTIGVKTQDGTAKGGKELDIDGQPALNEKGGRDYEPYDQVI